jgi:hypothetical protein
MFILQLALHFAHATEPVIWASAEQHNSSSRTEGVEMTW